jgi:hypothetical protein
LEHVPLQCVVEKGIATVTCSSANTYSTHYLCYLPVGVVLYKLYFPPSGRRTCFLFCLMQILVLLFFGGLPLVHAVVPATSGYSAVAPIPHTSSSDILVCATIFFYYSTGSVVYVTDLCTVRCHAALFCACSAPLWLTLPLVTFSHFIRTSHRYVPVRTSVSSCI